MLPLRIFEPRYLAMLEDVIANERVLGMVQPAGGEEDAPISNAARLQSIACVGRVTAFEELDDGHRLITLTGIARCVLDSEVAIAKPYRTYNVSYEPFAGDFKQGAGEHDVDRDGLLRALKRYLEVHKLGADWSAISKASTERLVNSLAVISPYGPREKQALLEAPDLKTRAQVLVALAAMDVAAGAGGSGSVLQ
jgi:hypothetical protein